MGAGSPSFAADFPGGFPAVVVAGQAVSLSLFVPACHDDKLDIQPLHRHRARVAGHGEKAFVQFYDDPKNKPWREHVAGWCRRQVLETDVEGTGDDEFKIPFQAKRVLANLRFNFHKPVSYPARVTVHTKKPDVDNLAKAILDALVKEAKILGDDNMVTDLNVQKRYIEPGHPEGVEIDLTILPVEVC